MNAKMEEVSADEARKAVRAMAQRVALLHMCYARTLVDELGDEAGEEIIKQAIWAYGTLVGERTRSKVEALGLQATTENFRQGSDLSPLGFDSRQVVIDGESRSQSYGCAMAEIWQEYGEEALGDLYCLVDAAKMQAYNSDWTFVHTKKVLRGDECCELAVRPSSSS
jgi:hypothetical protein